MKGVRLTNVYNDQPVWLNPAFVAVVEPKMERSENKMKPVPGVTLVTIGFAAGEQWYEFDIKGEPEEVAEQIWGDP